MDYYVGLDVSLHSISVCVVNEKGKVMHENDVSSTPEAVAAYLKGVSLEIKTIGLESGNLTHYLKKGLMEMQYEVVAIESRKMAAILATIINKTDTNDARGIAEAVRTGHYQTCVHRSEEAVEIRSILHSRATLVKNRTHISNSIKGHLKMYGIKLGKGRTKDFSERVKNAISALSSAVQQCIKALLRTLEFIGQELRELDALAAKIAQEDEDVQLLKTVDGVGDITALSFKAEIDDPHRFKNSKDVAAYLGLTPSQYSSGETQKQGRISKRGSTTMRSLLVESSLVLMTRCRLWSKHKAWAMKLARKKGLRKARVALARKLAVTMHRMLITRESFKRGDQKEKQSVA